MPLINNHSTEAYLPVNPIFATIAKKMGISDGEYSDLVSIEDLKKNLMINLTEYDGSPLLSIKNTTFKWTNFESFQTLYHPPQLIKESERQAGAIDLDKIDNVWNSIDLDKDGYMNMPEEFSINY